MRVLYVAKNNETEVKGDVESNEYAILIAPFRFHEQQLQASG